MLDLAGHQVGAAQRAGAAHHEADRLHLGAHRVGLAGAGLAWGRRLRGAEPGTWERTARRARSAGERAGRCTRCGLRIGVFGVEESIGEAVAWVSRARLATSGFSGGFICFPGTLPPAPKGRSHRELERRPGPGEPANLLRKRALGPRPRRPPPSPPPPPAPPPGVPAEGLAQVPGLWRVGGRLRGHLEVSRLEIRDQPLGTGPRIAWAGGLPRLVLVYKCKAVSMSHIPSLKLLPRIWALGAHWFLLRAGFYSSQWAAFKKYGLLCHWTANGISDLKSSSSKRTTHVWNWKYL